MAEKITQDSAITSPSRQTPAYERRNFSHAVAQFPCECGQWDRGNRSIEKELEHPAIHGENHEKGQHGDKQASQQRDRPERDGIPEADGVDLVNDLRWQSSAACEASRGGHSGNRSLCHGENCHHEIEPVSHRCLGKHEADEKSDGSFRTFQLRQAAARFDDARGEKQHQQPVADSLEGAVDAEHHAPDPAALEGGGILREKLPELCQPAVPGVQSGIEVVDNPVRRRFTSRAVTGLCRR